METFKRLNSGIPILSWCIFLGRRKYIFYDNIVIVYFTL